MNIREQRIQLSGSPYYAISCPIIAKDTFKIWSYESTELLDAKKYEPLDWIEITNDDVVAVELQINQRDKFYVPMSTIKAISDFPIWSVIVRNLSSTTDSVSGKIRLILQKQPLTVDKYVRRFKL